MMNDTLEGRVKWKRRRRFCSRRIY